MSRRVIGTSDGRPTASRGTGGLGAGLRSGSAGRPFGAGAHVGRGGLGHFRTPSPFKRIRRIRPAAGFLITPRERAGIDCAHGPPPRVRGIPARACRRHGSAERRSFLGTFYGQAASGVAAGNPGAQTSAASTTIRAIPQDRRMGQGPMPQVDPAGPRHGVPVTARRGLHRCDRHLTGHARGERESRDSAWPGEPPDAE
jgi:hypothetical protein